LELGRVNKIMPRRWGYGTKRFWDYALGTRTEEVPFDSIQKKFSKPYYICCEL
jgi:hypothetical protein